MCQDEEDEQESGSAKGFDVRLKKKQIYVDMKKKLK